MRKKKNTKVVPEPSSHRSAAQKGLAVGKEDICRFAPISTRTLTRMLERGDKGPLMDLIRIDPQTGRPWAFISELIAYRDNSPSASGSSSGRKAS